MNQPRVEPTPPRAPSKVGLCTSPVHSDHRADGHPERPERLAAIEQALRERGLHEQFASVEPRRADEPTLELVHSGAQLQRLRELAAAGGGHLDPDTYVTRASYEAACWAAGAVVALVDAVCDGVIGHGLALVRPPGHHATPTRSMGFCLINNVAVGVRYAQRRRGVGPALVVDWDVHHGNGTQDTFYSDGRVAYLSTHGWPLYPGTGAQSERGEGPGAGLCVNVPLPPGSDDAALESAFARALGPLAERIHPELVFVSAGFDAHARDPLGCLRATSEVFGRLTRQVLALGAPVIVVLEGGYDLVALGQSVASVAQELLDGGARSLR